MSWLSTFLDNNAGLASGLANTILPGSGTMLGAFTGDPKNRPGTTVTTTTNKWPWLFGGTQSQTTTQSGMPGGPMVPRGWKWSEKRKKWVRCRRMNVMNVRAARRAVRRIKGARALLWRIERSLPKAHHHSHRGR